jgi:predicted nicotinamide N-methyase
VVALERGAGVTATDHYAPALDFTRYNARVNLGIEPNNTWLLDWHSPDKVGLREAFDLVLAADVLYEKRNVSALAALIPTLLVPGGEALIADPHRKDAPEFLERMKRGGFLSSVEESAVTSGDGHRATVLVHWLRRH